MLLSALKGSIAVALMSSLALVAAAEVGRTYKVGPIAPRSPVVSVEVPLGVSVPEPRTIFVPEVIVTAVRPKVRAQAIHFATPVQTCKPWRRVKMTGGWVRECG